MKMIKRVLSVTTTLALSVCLMYPAFAATYDVDHEDQISDIVNNPNKNTGDDRNVTLNLKNDIGESTIDARKDWTYTIQGNGHSIGELVTEGEGTVVVNADVQSAFSGVIANEKTNVTVTGNITADQVGAEANGDSKVTVNGNIESNGTGASAAENAELTVNGDIKSNGVGSIGANVTGNADLTVKGNIESGGIGLYVDNTIGGTVNAEVIGDIDAQSYGAKIGTTGNSNAEVRVTGDISGCVQDNPSTYDGAVEIYLIPGTSGETGNVTYEQTGDVTSGDKGIYMNTSSGGPAAVTVNGDIQSAHGNCLEAENSSLSLTVNGDTVLTGPQTVQDPVYELVLIGDDPAAKQVTLNHNGNIIDQTQSADGIEISHTGDTGTVEVNLNGNMDLGKSRGGIQISAPDSCNAVELTVTGKVDYPVYSLDQEYSDVSHIKLIARDPILETVTIPELRIPVSFESEDLDGNPLSTSGHSMLLVYFDPADPECIAELQKGQEAHENGSTVYAVCMTEDWEAARAAAEEAGVTYPVLKLSESLQSILENSGETPPAGVMLSGTTLVSPERTETRITGYTVTHPVLEFK